jgi:hypothetical protein
MKDALVDETPLRDALDLAAWEPPASPSPDFTARVVAEARRGKSARRRGIWASVAALAAAAAAVALWTARAPSSGDVVAKSRTTVHVGARALVVAEPGTHVAWRGDDVTQDRGDAFYRVEPKGSFRVTTPAGDVEVKGTCFRVKVGNDMNKRDAKAGGVGAAMAAIAFVGVYEGKVAVARGGQTVVLEAGEAAQIDDHGVQKADDPEAARARFEARVEPEGDPMLAANQSLAASVKALEDRLGALDQERSRLATQLDQANAKLADAAAPNPNMAYAPSQDEWKELAAKGKVKFRAVACLSARGWAPDKDEQNALGLSPDDAKTIRAAYAREYEREWSQVRPICAQVFSPEVADRLGPGQCESAIVHVLGDGNWKRVQAAITAVAEARAGVRPVPASPEDPIERVFLLWTGGLREVETDLARSFGPEEAHRLVFSEGMCAYNTTW